jgi:hypothetical protein
MSSDNGNVGNQKAGLSQPCFFVANTPDGIAVFFYGIRLSMKASDIDTFRERLHRTWIQVLLEANYREIAALVVDAEFMVDYNQEEQPSGVILKLPPTSFLIVKNTYSIMESIEKSLRLVGSGYFIGHWGGPNEEFPIEFRAKLLDVEPNWRDITKSLILNAKDPNQSLITEKVFARKRKQILTYNEMKFGSKSEIRIAQELERRKVLFFPLPLAVRADTGEMYEDHREIDFLVCDNGRWGILEVAFHQDRYEKDSEKGGWFKKSGILCVEYYTAERCYEETSKVVDEFLSILSKHK